MATFEEVKKFLEDFRIKLGIGGVVFRDDRSKNAQTLLILDIMPIHRKKILKEMQAIDYSEGRKRENLNGGADMWAFGKMIKAIEVYIKITLGFAGMQVICISFHIAEYPMKYPLKK